MSEVVEIYQEIREERKNKRWNNYEKSKQILIDRQIDFTEKANGHFIIENYDFWATTGLFIHRKRKKRGRGIHNLLKQLKGGKRCEGD